jgi:HK97 family phage portal protein
MGFLTNFITEKRNLPFGSGTVGESPWLFMEVGKKTKSGAVVNENIALSISTVWACVRILAWTIASLPLITYKRLERGKERAVNFPVYDILKENPNPYQTSFEFLSLMSVFQNLWGAGIAEIEYKDNTPVALWPIPPWMVKIKTSDHGRGGLFYSIDYGDGTTPKLIPAQHCVVFPSLQSSQFEWKSPIRCHSESIGMALSLTEFGARTFGQGTNPAGVLMHPSRLKEQSEKDLREKFRQNYEGLGNSHRIMLLEEGMRFERIGLPPEDAQYLETRKFTVEEIARIYNVPLHMIQHLEKSTSWGTGIEEMTIGFVTFTLRPYLVQWEQELKKKLFVDDKIHFPEFLIEGLLRGKLAERYAAYAIARQWGWFSADDIREIENMNPLADKTGEMYLVPMNMTDAKNAGKMPVENKPGGNKDEIDK